MEGVNITVYLPPLINISTLPEMLALLLKIYTGVEHMAIWDKW
jgi:hypothetical protein